MCEHVVVGVANARGDDGRGRGDGGDGGRWAIGQQNVSLWTVQRNLLCRFYNTTETQQEVTETLCDTSNDSSVLTLMEP